MPSISCAVVGTDGTSLLAVDAPSSSSVGEVSNLLKARRPQAFRDVIPLEMQMFRTGSHGRYISSTSFELGLLPEFLEAGEYKWASEYILSDWEELHPDENTGNALPPATGGDRAQVVQIVALIPVRKVVCACGHNVFRVSINESAAVAELKDEIHRRMAGMSKLVKAKIGNLSLTRDEVRGRHSLQVADRLRLLAASDEIDTSRTVRAVFGDRESREAIDVLIVPYEINVEPLQTPAAGGGRSNPLQQSSPVGGKVKSDNF
ncbi:hypothetical protein PF008_g19518 [Phytophthora fragariae]|uniref:Uncharacterized protein n=1 Tax=Phytophthora fragariae TaxID=53985 RepID=A0A6G0R3F7_9STRA|nr:hypothetical protein PF008_g19518 [Phytophthora fragariae]